MEKSLVNPEGQHLVVPVVSTDQSQGSMQSIPAHEATGDIFKPSAPRIPDYALPKTTAEFT